jgi:putative protease
VAAIQVEDVLRVGDTIHAKGHTSDFTQKIDSMQVDNHSVPEAAAGQTIGLRVKDHAHEHDFEYKLVE